MAKPKKQEGNDKKTSFKTVWLWLLPKDHQRLREAAAKRGKPMSEFSREAVLEAIDKVLGRKS